MLSLNKEFVLVFKWYKKLTGRFINISFFQTFIVIISTLFSQIFLLLSSMLPLKVIMLLGSDKIPKFFPDSWQNTDKDMLIIYLAILSIIFFLLHIFSEKIIELYSLKGSKKILENNQKIVLFEKQDIFAKNAYTKLSKSLSNIIFFIFSVVGLGFLYPLLSLAIVSFLFFTYLFFYISYKNHRMLKKLEENYKSFIDIIRTIGFFFVFVFILGSFLTNFYPPHLTIVILSILLVRQMFSKLASAIKDIIQLYKDRLKINSIFFFKDTKINLLHEKKDPFWQILQNEKRNEWIPKVLSLILNQNVIYVNSIILKINIKNIVFIQISTTDSKKTLERNYLLKLFNKNISTQAIHEATLLEENELTLPFLGVTVVENFHIHLFEFSDVKFVENFKTDSLLVRLNLMRVKPSKQIISRYNRSHQYLHQRISNTVFEKLYLMANSNELELLKKFEDQFNVINMKIKALPLQYINPLITKYTLVKKDDRLCLLHFGNWKLEPLGVDFPISIKSIEYLNDHFDILLNERDRTKTLQFEDVVLAALIAQFEKFYLSEHFTGIFELIPRILECIKND